MAKRSSATATPPRVFVDADIWVDLLTRSTERHVESGEERWRIAEALIVAILEGRVVLASDTLIEAEVSCNGKVKNTRVPDRIVKDRFSDLMRSPATLVTEIDRILVQHAITLSEKHGLRGADATHLAAAVRLDCAFFMSHDNRFPFGETVDRVQVLRPRQVWEAHLFDELE